MEHDHCTSCEEEQRMGYMDEPFDEDGCCCCREWQLKHGYTVEKILERAKDVTRT